MSLGGIGLKKNYRRYDPRLRNLVATSANLSRFILMGIPKSTLREWQKKGQQEFISLPEFDLTATELIQENLNLSIKLAAAGAEQELLSTSINIFGFQVQYKRLPSTAVKTDIIAAIRKAAMNIPLQKCLSTIGLSAARYHAWLKREVKCLLQDQSSCPRVSPTKLTSSEVSKIRDLYTSSDFAHFSMQSLSWLAKKTGDVMASASTWSRVVRQLGLKRNRMRIYPPKPKLGIRASAPGQIWHLDLTILRLQDGTKAFVQCIIDNYSRYVLAWKISRDYGGLRTKELILTAILKARDLGLNLCRQKHQPYRFLFKCPGKTRQSFRKAPGNKRIFVALSIKGSAIPQGI